MIVSLATVSRAQDGAAQTAGAVDTADIEEKEPTDLERAWEMHDRLKIAVDSIVLLVSDFHASDAEQRQVLRVRGHRHVEVLTDVQPQLLDLILELKSDSSDVQPLVDAVSKLITDQIKIHEESIRWYSRRIDDLREERESARPEELGEYETRIKDARSRLDEFVEGEVQTLQIADTLGMNTSAAWKSAERYIQERAETLVVDRTSRLLESLGHETTLYRKFIIQVSGEVTEDILDPKVLWGILKDAFRATWKWLSDNAPAILIQLLIFMAIVVLTRIAFRIGWWLFQLLGLIKFSRLMADMLSRLVKPVATIAGIIVGLWFLGVDPTTLMAGVGVAGIIVGLALQDSLSNLAAGMFILSTRPYDVDDVIRVGGVLGKVRAMGLANTTVITFDNRRMLIPNRKIWGDNIENRSAEPIRRLDMVVRIGYNEDLARAMEILRELVKEDERVLDTPEPHIFVWELADSWIDIAVRPWVWNADWWPMWTDLPRQVRLRFAEKGIDIPIPRREISTSDGPNIKTTD
jgi:small conductance mechanosensitive channel